LEDVRNKKELFSFLTGQVSKTNFPVQKTVVITSGAYKSF
jgi:hypothetical protein